MIAYLPLLFLYLSKSTFPANISCFPITRRLQHNRFSSSKTSWRRLEEDVLQIYLKDILRTSWRRLVRQKNVTLKTASRHLQDVFSAYSPRWMFQRGFHVVSTWNTRSVFKGMFPVTLNKCSGTFAFLTYIILELSTHECFLKKVAYLLIYSIVSECL